MRHDKYALPKLTLFDLLAKWRLLNGILAFEQEYSCCEQGLAVFSAP